MKKFCGECGSKLAKHFLQSFDEKTGKQEIAKHCTNLNCEQGCDHVGHIWGGLFGLGNTCKRCGYRIYDFYH